MAGARAATSGYIPDIPRTRQKSYQWNFGIQHEFRGNYIFFETRYVGTRGQDLPVQDQRNIQPVVTRGPAALVLVHAQSGYAQLAHQYFDSLLNFYDSAAGGLVPACLKQASTGRS